VVSNSWDTRRYVASARQADPQRRYRLLYEDEIRSVEGRGPRLDDPDAASEYARKGLSPLSLQGLARPRLLAWSVFVSALR
jgi:hypothetical protein